MSFNNRSDALIELLEELTQEDHEYVLVGGYAVSAFNARFSTDLDIVVAPDSKADFVEFLERQGLRRNGQPRQGVVLRHQSNRVREAAHASAADRLRSPSKTDSGVARPRHSGRSTTCTTTATNRR